MHPLDQSYHDLANAIVLQAVEDYRNALNGIAYHHHSPEFVIKSIERFFRSDYFEVLSTVKGEYLIEQLKKEHNERSKDESNTATGNA
jgi:hypothetical protein